MFLTPSARARAIRPGLVLLACLAAVVAMLGLPRQPAWAGNGCIGPGSMGISGPEGASTTQPGGMPISLTLLARDGSPAASLCANGPVSFAWSVSWPDQHGQLDAGNAASATLTGFVGSSADISVTATSGFGETRSVISARQTVTFHYLAPTLVVPTPVTAGQSTAFRVEPNSETPSSYGYQWTFGDGTPRPPSTTDATTTHVFASPGDYGVTVHLLAPRAVTDSLSALVHVYAPVSASFVASDSAVTGAPVTVDGTSSTSDVDAPVVGYSWDFGDGGRATGSSPSHVYWTTGTFTITETVTDSLGRTASTIHDISVTPGSTEGPAPSGAPPVASFTTTTASPTAAAPVSFDGTGSSDSDGSIVSYSWTFGDGGTDSRMQPQHTYGEAGDYPVTLTVTDDDGLSRSVTHTVTVADAAPSAAFTASSSPIAGSAVSFDGTGSDDADGTVQQYAWDFGDGSTGTGPAQTHPYAKAGSYDVVLTVTDDAGLTATGTHTVTVARAAPVADMVPPAGAVATSPFTFDGRPSSDVDGTVQHYAWDFGDGTSDTGATPSHAFPRAGRYVVTLTVTDDDGLTGSTSRNLDVAGAPPVAAFTAPAGAAGMSAAFDGTASSDPDGSIRNYAWDFGDGHTAIGATPGHTFETPNTYPVTLTVTDDSGLTNSVTHLVTVGAAALPSASFISSASAPAVGTPVSFDGSGSSAPGGAITSYAWTFGDGGTGTTAKPSHTYTSAGSFPVTLTVTDAAGHTASVTHVVTAQWPATDLAVAVGGSAPKAGQYTYRVTVKNLGHNAAHGIVLTNALDPTRVLAGKVTAPAGVACGGVPVGSTGAITCKASPSAVLAAGKSWVITFTVKQPLRSRVRQVTETSTVRAANPDGVAKNNTARLTTAV